MCPVTDDYESTRQRTRASRRTQVVLYTVLAIATVIASAVATAYIGRVFDSMRGIL